MKLKIAFAQVLGIILVIAVFQMCVGQETVNKSTGKVQMEIPPDTVYAKVETLDGPMFVYTVSKETGRIANYIGIGKDCGMCLDGLWVYLEAPELQDVSPVFIKDHFIISRTELGHRED